MQEYWPVTFCDSLVIGLYKSVRVKFS